jgi:hypothetical protein
MSAGADKEGQEKWTEEELKQKEYGVLRSMLRQFKVEKSHVVAHLKWVMSAYPALEGVLEYLVDINTNAEEVADAISGGVPMSRETLCEKAALGEWFRNDILRPPETIPDDCQYVHILRQMAQCLTWSLQSGPRCCTI